MSAIAQAARNWKRFTPSQRHVILKITEGEEDAETLVWLDDFDDLPSHTCGRLLLAMTNDGFTAAAYEESLHKLKAALRGCNDVPPS